MFGDRFVKIVSNFEIKFFCHCLVTFEFQRSPDDDPHGHRRVEAS
jgi:hypothetical protein